MESYIDKGYKEIERKYEGFFKSVNKHIEQYVIIGKKSEKFEEIKLEVVLNKELPEEIKNEVRELYKPLLD